MDLGNFQLRRETKITNERQAILKEFVEQINLEREGTAYSKIWPKVVALKLSHLNKSELYWFLSTCKDYASRKGSFSRCFFGALKNGADTPNKKLWE